jgi:hypothetical protein
MDDARIHELKQEVLGQLRKAQEGAVAHTGLETRVAALEKAVATLASRLVGSGVPGSAPAPPSHPSLQVFSFPASTSDRCLMEPDKPCVKSHACRVLGY